MCCAALCPRKLNPSRKARPWRHLRLPVESGPGVLDGHQCGGCKRCYYCAKARETTQWKAGHKAEGKTVTLRNGL